MKKTITAILAIIMLLSINTVAFAAYTPTPIQPGYTPYAGDDFSEEAVYERMTALEEVYPTGTPWTTTKAGGYRDCGAFVNMLQEAAFGYVYDGNTLFERRVHNNVDELRVGDYIRVPSNVNSWGHYVCVIGIKDGIVTIAEGNINKQVKWGRQFTIKSLSPGGANATREIGSYYNEDGEVVRRAIQNNYVAPTTPAETTTPAATAPAATITPAKPAAPAQTTVTETKTATTTTTENKGETLTVSVTTKDSKVVYSIKCGNVNVTKNYSDNGRQNNGVHNFAVRCIGGNQVTVEYAGKVATIGLNQTATITANGTVTIK